METGQKANISAIAMEEQMLLMFLRLDLELEAVERVQTLK
jgi:hypothetical protein